MGEVTMSRLRAVFLYLSVIALGIDSAVEYGQDTSTAKNVASFALWMLYACWAFGAGTRVLLSGVRHFWKYGLKET